ncbi:N-acetylmuramoyl-L-alanine amidase [Pantanalinema sp. GBBB05]|uniref:N-acetylmuramoyl-L-alanine amidase n=1 Tax=Pantanalinema sp. GBBB05 TaxID=2604139 RepID=UPI001D365C5A|nr:cell wall hydrolase [Pantanalinema sp. GBBB05]
MGRIFISAGHGGQEDGKVDPGAVVAGTTEAREMILTRDLIMAELQGRQVEVLSVPDDLSLEQTIAWINARARSGDVALEIHADASTTSSVRGSSVFFIAQNEERRKHADLLLLALLRRVPQLPNRGAKPDTSTGTGSLAFCRQLLPASLLMEIGFLTNADDRTLIQNRRKEIATGIADGLQAWSQAIAVPTPLPSPSPSPTPTPSPTPVVTPSPIAAPFATTPTVSYPTCNINLNSQNYGEKGIIINGNSFIPVDLVDRLGVDVTQNPQIRKVSYRNVVYIKAIDLREFNISVGWDNPTRTVILRTILQICPNQIDRLSGHGKTSDVQMLMFLKANNEAALKDFADLPKLYREEGDREGINYDIAFAQMCLETSFLRFGGTLQPSQNNYGGLGGIGNESGGASFPSARLGIRAHIQHLKAYANTQPLVEEVVDPRFNFVARGIAPLVQMLGARWTADAEYGTKILAILRRLYEAAGIL